MLNWIPENKQCWVGPGLTPENTARVGLDQAPELGWAGLAWNGPGQISRVEVGFCLRVKHSAFR